MIKTTPVNYEQEMTVFEQFRVSTLSFLVDPGETEEL